MLPSKPNNQFRHLLKLKDKEIKMLLITLLLCATPSDKTTTTKLPEEKVNSQVSKNSRTSSENKKTFSETTVLIKSMLMKISKNPSLKRNQPKELTSYNSPSPNSTVEPRNQSQTSANLARRPSSKRSSDSDQI